MKKLIIFTDLDETLLERRTYSFKKAKPALALLRAKDIPLVIVSSKTMAEIELYRRKLENRHPFISENGGGIFIPEGYFTDYLEYKPKIQGGYEVITLGTSYEKLRKAMAELQAEGFNVRGFGDMTAAEISRLTNLTLEEAALASQRHFDEPFTCDRCDIGALGNSIYRKGLHLTQGRLFHLIGENNKGTAVEALKRLYKAKLGDVSTAALGDSPTDILMLEYVDYPIAVRKDDGSFDPVLEIIPNLIKADETGSSGWNSTVMELIKKLGL